MNRIFVFVVIVLMAAVAWPDFSLAHPPTPDQYTFQRKTYLEKHQHGFQHNQAHKDFVARSTHASYTLARGQVAAVPGSYSMRGNAGPVENQGQCGTCWDFSLTTVLRGTLIMAGHDPGRLSFNYLLNCDFTMQGCNGGDFSAAEMFESPYPGAPAYGSDGSYTGVQGTCQRETGVALATAYYMLGTNSTNPSFEDIAYVVGVLHRPVTVDIAADDLFEQYASGIYNGCDDESAQGINHMVSVEGYSCESSVDSSGNCAFNSSGNLPAGVGYWVIRNSWGTQWGDRGYVTMRATDGDGQRCNAVGTDALYYDVPGSPTPTPTPVPTATPTPVPTPPAPRPTPNPTPQPPPSNIASSPLLNGQTTLAVNNPLAPVTFTWNVSGFSGAAGIYYEISAPNRPFATQNGVTPDPSHFYGAPLTGTTGTTSFVPAQSLPAYGTYQFRVIPLNSTFSQPVGQFSNPSTFIVSPP